MEKKQLKVSESEYAKNLGVAASTGAAIGGAAFAAAAYSTRAWETDSNEDNETLEIVEESSTDEMIQPETVSIEISDPVTADIAYTIDPLSPAESEAIDMASTENDEIVIEDISHTGYLLGNGFFEDTYTLHKVGVGFAQADIFFLE